MSVLSLEPTAVQWHRVDGEIMALDVAGGEYFTLNGSGTVLWSLLAEGTTRDGLVAALHGAYDLPAAAAQADVDNFLSALRERRLLAGAG